MKAIGLSIGFLLLTMGLALGQGYESVPEDAVIVGLGEPGSAYEALESGARGGRYVIGLKMGTRTWNPLYAGDGGSAFCAGLMHKGLVGLHPVTGVYVPELANSWTVSEDGLTITFHLRKGIRWSDGKPFTADDVLFTYNDLILDDEVAAGRAALRLPDDSFPVIEKLDDHTVSCALSVPFRPILDALTADIVPEHILAEFVHKLNPEATAGTFDAVWTLDTAPDQIVGLGPFILAEYRPDEYALLERNPYYYHYDANGLQLPYIDELLILLVESKETELLKFLNGELHSIEALATDSGILHAEAAAREYAVRVAAAGHLITFCMFNLDTEETNLRSLFRNPAFRKAMAHTQDVEGALNRLDGLGDRQWSPLAMSSPYYAGREYYGGPITETHAIWYDYDLEAASALLDSCGIFDRNGDGVREFEDGSPVEIEFVTVTGNEIASQFTLAMAADCAAIGVKLNANFLSFYAVGDLLESGRWQAIGLQFGMGQEPHGIASLLRSSGGYHTWHKNPPLEDVFPYEQDIDRLLDEAAGIYDPDEAFELYKEIQQIFAREDLGMIFSLQPRKIIGVYNTVGNGAAIQGTGASVLDILFLRGEA